MWYDILVISVSACLPKPILVKVGGGVWGGCGCLLVSRQTHPFVLQLQEPNSLLFPSHVGIQSEKWIRALLLPLAYKDRRDRQMGRQTKRCGEMIMDKMME